MDFIYDETSPTCLRWRVYRKGSGKGKPKWPGDVAGLSVGRYCQVDEQSELQEDMGELKDFFVDGVIVNEQVFGEIKAKLRN